MSPISICIFYVVCLHLSAALSLRTTVSSGEKRPPRLRCGKEHIERSRRSRPQRGLTRHHHVSTAGASTLKKKSISSAPRKTRKTKTKIVSPQFPIRLLPFFERYPNLRIFDDWPDFWPNAVSTLGVPRPSRLLCTTVILPSWK